MAKVHVSDEAIRDPPRSFFGRLRFLGPGFILSASIVGSGELIATTTLGAKAGFTAFWIIILSCLVKVAVQVEMGRYTILRGRTAMQLFNALPGPSLATGKWSLWIIFFLFTLKFIQLGGMVGSTAIVLNMLVPLPVYFWAFAVAFSASVFIALGYYGVIEMSSLVMTVLFTTLTIACVFALALTPYRITPDEILSGLTFRLTGEMLAVAIGAFGITGVSSDEIIAYNYWCTEKGYAAYTGRPDGSDAWKERAHGWIRVMYLDAIMAMVIYTAVTAAFFLLGAAILHDKGAVPEGTGLIETVAIIYTESLGPWVRNLYLIGAFFVLFSSVFATLAAWTRTYPDIFHNLGWINFLDPGQRRTTIAILAWIIPLLWVLMYMSITLPVGMILFGGVVGSIMLLMVVFAVVYARRESETTVRSSGWFAALFWTSVIAIAAFAIYSITVIVI